jgi:hypothetical protein
MPPTHHKIYEKEMLKALEGTPQFSADPEGNETLGVTGKIEIGDWGYFRSVHS